MNPAARVERALEGVAATREPPHVTGEDVVVAVRAHGDLRDGDRWGRWRYDAGADLLAIHPYGSACPYDVPLSQCRTEEEVLEWILHVSRKVWASSEDVGDLVRALERIGPHHRAQRPRRSA